MTACGEGGKMDCFCRAGSPRTCEGDRMSDHVYKSIELTGSSSQSIEDAVNTAIAKASETVRNIQWFNIVETRGHVREGRVAYWQVTIKIGFTLE
jgi:flavin-binding protein dodecin